MTVSEADLHLGDLPADCEMMLALALEHPDASMTSLGQAVTGKPNGNPLKRLTQINSGNIQDVAEQYYQDKEMPDTSHIDEEDLRTGTPLSEILEGDDSE